MAVCSRTKGVKHTVVLIGNIVYPPIRFSKRQPRLSSTHVTLWFGKHSYDCLAGVNLLLTAVTSSAHVIYFTFLFQDEPNHSFSFFIFSFKTSIAFDLTSLNQSLKEPCKHVGKGVKLLSNVPVQGRVCNHTVTFQPGGSECDCGPCPTLCVGLWREATHTEWTDSKHWRLTQVFTMMPTSQVRKCLDVFFFNHCQLWAHARFWLWQHKEPAASSQTRLFNYFITIKKNVYDWKKMKVAGLLFFFTCLLFFKCFAFFFF